MNWYLVLFGFIGMALVFFYELYRIGFKKINWPAAALRYGVDLIVLLVIVHFHHAKEVQGAMIFLAFIWVALLINNLADKLKSKTIV